jgi:hypothetical protein
VVNGNTVRTINRVFIETNAGTIIGLDSILGMGVNAVGLYKMVYVSHIEDTKMELFAQYWDLLLAFVLGAAVAVGLQGGLLKAKEPVPEPVEHPENPPPLNANTNVNKTTSRPYYTDIS